MEALQKAQQKLQIRWTDNHSIAAGDCGQMVLAESRRFFHIAVKTYSQQNASRSECENCSDDPGSLIAMAVISEIIAQRLQRNYVNGYPAEHDDHCQQGEQAQTGSLRDSHSSERHSPRRSLVVAAALILAEIERIDRMADKTLRTR